MQRATPKSPSQVEVQGPRLPREPTEAGLGAGSSLACRLIQGPTKHLRPEDRREKPQGPELSLIALTRISRVLHRIPRTHAQSIEGFAEIALLGSFWTLRGMGLGYLDIILD